MSERVKCENHGEYIRHKRSQDCPTCTEEYIENIKMKLNDKISDLTKRGEWLEIRSERLSAGREYLMSVQPDNLTVEDALEAFGFSRNGCV